MDCKEFVNFIYGMLINCGINVNKTLFASVIESTKWLSNIQSATALKNTAHSFAVHIQFIKVIYSS